MIIKIVDYCIFYIEVHKIGIGYLFVRWVYFFFYYLRNQNKYKSFDICIKTMSQSLPCKAITAKSSQGIALNGNTINEKDINQILMKTAKFKTLLILRIPS